MLVTYPWIPSTVDFLIESNNNVIEVKIWSKIHYKADKATIHYEGLVRNNLTKKNKHFHKPSELLYQVFKEIGLSLNKMIIYDKQAGDSSYFTNMFEFLLIIENRYLAEEKKRLKEAKEYIKSRNVNI